MLCVQATFESSKKAGSNEYDFEQEALAKRHSMTHEAVQTGKAAGAYRTILTHFSQRYPKIPVVDDSFQDSTCIAFDLMCVNLKGGASMMESDCEKCRLRLHPQLSASRTSAQAPPAATALPRSCQLGVFAASNCDAAWVSCVLHFL